jgi:hypothetical protein
MVRVTRGLLNFRAVAFNAAFAFVRQNLHAHTHWQDHALQAFFSFIYTHP